MQRLVCLDLIRIFACLCILVIHFNASVSGYDIFGRFVYANGVVPNDYGGVYLGDIGVGIFFILSGASLQYTNNIVSLQSVKLFYYKRAKAIYPQFWLAWFVATLISFLWYKGMTNAAPEKILVSLAGLDGYAMLILQKGYQFYQVGEWFLGCIIIIYLIYPFFAIAVNKYLLPTVVIISIIYFAIVGKVDDKWFFLQLPYIGLGMMWIKYLRFYKKRNLWICTGLLILLRIMFVSKLAYLTVAIITCWSIFLFIASIYELIPEFFNRYTNLLAHLSELTYSAFLVHHKLITMLAGMFNLEAFPYRNTVTLFIIYMILTYYLSVKLNDAGKKLSKAVF